MSIAALIRAMAEAGATPEAIALAVDALEAKDQKEADRKAAQRERTRRSRSRRDGNVTVTPALRDGNGDPSPKKETSPTPPKEKTTPSSSEANASSKPRGDLAEFRAELAADLSPGLLSELEKHRAKKKAPMTGHAARLFRRDVDACGISLPEAVNTCISRNWITVKPDWIAPKPDYRNQSGGKRTSSQAAADLLQELEDGRQTPRGQSHSRDVELLPSPGGIGSRYAAPRLSDGRR